MNKSCALLHPNDDVFIALQTIPVGTQIDEGIVTTSEIVAGHKVARRALEVGSSLHRYNQIIGQVSSVIAPGDHVHMHNLEMADFERDYAFCQNNTATNYITESKTFMGIRRDNGGVATRNYIGILSSVNCSATVAKLAAQHFLGDWIITLMLTVLLPLPTKAVVVWTHPLKEWQPLNGHWWVM